MLDKLMQGVLGNPEIVQTIVQNITEQYKPVIYTILNEILVAYEELSENERVAKVAAKLKRNYFNAYIEAGFTEEQAMEFLSGGMLSQLSQVLVTAAEASAVEATE